MARPSPQALSATAGPAAALPTVADVRRAAARLAGVVRRTPVLTSPELDELTGLEIHFKCENLQLGGSFKYRGASNALAVLLEGAEWLAPQLGKEVPSMLLRSGDFPAEGSAARAAERQRPA